MPMCEGPRPLRVLYVDLIRCKSTLETVSPLAREAVFFGRPQIDHVGRTDGAMVVEACIGIAVDPSDPVQEAVRIIAAAPDTWAAYGENARKLASTWISFNEDFANILTRLQGIA